MEEGESTCSAAAVELRDGHLQLLSKGNRQNQIQMKKDYPQAVHIMLHTACVDRAGRSLAVLATLDFLPLHRTVELNHKKSVERGQQCGHKPHTSLPVQ